MGFGSGLTLLGTGEIIGCINTISYKKIGQSMGLYEDKELPTFSSHSVK